jgi:glutamate:GABA antiporter
VNPDWAQNKAYLVTTSLAIFWILTGLNLKGIRVSALLNNILALLGIALPLLILIILASLWVLKGYPVQIEFKRALPNLTKSTTWISLIAILASFLGMELSAVHVNDIRQPQKNFPKAFLCACTFILLSMGGGALAIALVLPQKEIDLVSGIMQVFAGILQAFGLTKWTPFLICLIAAGSIGTMINWIISPAKGLQEASVDGFLPPFFARQNRSGVASKILITQAILVSLFSLLFLLEPNVNSYFWLLTALSTELYMLMYLLMFSAALVLRHRNPVKGAFQIPGGMYGLGVTCLLGIVGSLVTIIVSFLPSTNIENGESIYYILKIGLGNVITLFPIILFYLYSKMKKAKVEV